MPTATPFGSSTPADLRTIEREQAEIEKADPCPFPGATPIGARRRRAVAAPVIAEEASAEESLPMLPRLCGDCADRGVTSCTTCGVPDINTEETRDQP